ncbi:related to nitrogen metabolic regulation protein nmr [Fusarium torulosum]|uniref:Related to nitrogen metabolic regulation protein nmr n=1 Tax=Fusarium torulosum TaxID=33205 RepID=A0AAE8M2Q9_9HYPO|nr:related to nitrogen metabolic regulation protein nmr [Fusarium torulosum]
MSKTLAIIGATGQQGTSVINFVLNDPELSKKYNIRAISRDVNSEKANKLKERGVEVVQGDLDDSASIKKGLTGAHTLFLVTTPSWTASDLKPELDVIKKTADTAVEAGVEYIIFSSLPSITDISRGKYTQVHPFDAKAEGEKYIRTLPVKSAFVRLGFFLENILQVPFWAPQKDAEGNWVMTSMLSPQTRLPWIDNGSNCGNYVGAILAEPDKYEGVGLDAAEGFYSMDELVAIESKVTGKDISYKEVTPDKFVEGVPFLKDVFRSAFKAAEEFGYFGPEGEKSVAWAAERVGGKLVSLEEFFRAHSFKLE